MKKIRLFVSVISSVIFVLGLTACGSKTPDVGTDNIVQTVEKAEENSESPAAEQEQTGSGKDTLVVFFSATGTTKGVAEKIAEITDADIYEIVPEEDYTSDDLNYNNSDSRASREQNDLSARPEISSRTIDLSGYERIYVGYPIWFGQEPRIMDTFVEAYDFGNITMIPFCTSGSSGIGQSGKHLEENAGSGNWLEGQRFSGNVSEDDLHSWIDRLQ